MTRAVVAVAAGWLALHGLGPACAVAQGAGTPNTGVQPVPPPQAAPPRPTQPAPADADVQLEGEAAPPPPAACPDTGRKLELVV
jgi:hypothetical protein